MSPPCLFLGSFLLTSMSNLDSANAGFTAAGHAPPRGHGGRSSSHGTPLSMPAALGACITLLLYRCVRGCCWCEFFSSLPPNVPASSRRWNSSCSPVPISGLNLPHVSPFRGPGACRAGPCQGHAKRGLCSGGHGHQRRVPGSAEGRGQCCEVCRGGCSGGHGHQRRVPSSAEGWGQCFEVSRGGCSGGHGHQRRVPSSAEGRGQCCEVSRGMLQCPPLDLSSQCR